MKLPLVYADSSSKGSRFLGGYAEMNTATSTPHYLMFGLAFLVSLCTLVWCVWLIRRLNLSPDRLLVGVVGLQAFLHVFKLARDTRIWPLPMPALMEPLHGLLTSLLFLAAVFLLGAYRLRHRSVEWRLRLAEANEASPAPVAVGAPATSPAVARH